MYGRILRLIDRMTDEKREAMWQELEAQNFEDVVDLVLYIEGQKEANKVESESLTQEILTKYWIEKWDGKLPKVSSDDSGIILSPELLDEVIEVKGE